MRLRRLSLHRYGHLTDAEIIFPDAPDLHVVVGPNEAGKSTALAAIGDALFRFPSRTQADFLHAANKLSVGVEVQARDGRTASFIRRKGNKDTLCDDAGNLLPESAIAAFLGGATRDRFKNVFGLDGATLREGGKKILDGKGDAGDTIMSAYAGVHNYRQVAEALGKQASQLFGDKKGNRLFYVAKEAFDTAKHTRDERRIDHVAWKALTAEQDRLEKAQSDDAARVQHLQAELKRLDRIRRTTSPRLRLAHLDDMRKALGPPPALPEDAMERFAHAVATRDQAARDLQRETDALAERDARLAALPPEDPVLTQAEAIDTLMADHARIAEALKDREQQRLNAAQSAAAMIADARNLGLSLTADDLAARIPTALDRERVAARLSAHERLEGRRSAAAEALAAAENRLTDAEQAVAAVSEATDPAALRNAIERVKAEGRLDLTLAQADRARQSARAELDTSIAALPGWTGDAAALASLAVPLMEQIDQAARALDDARSDLRDADLVLAGDQSALAQLAAATKADVATGELPTEAAILKARQNRDAAWALIRRAHLDAGAPVTADERAASGLTADTATGFAALIRTADALVDHRAREQERVVAAEQRLRQMVERQALHDTHAAQRQQVAARLGDAEAAWAALWAPVGFPPSGIPPSGIPPDPPAMKEWLGLRDAVLHKFTAYQTAERHYQDEAARHAAALSDLRSALPRDAAAADAVSGGSAADPDGASSVAEQLKTAERLCKALEAAVHDRQNAGKERDAAAADYRKAQQAMTQLTAEMAQWQQDWTAAVQRLSLDADAEPALSQVALRHWDAIDKAERSRQAALDRVAAMTAAIDAYHADARAVLAAVAPAELDGDVYTAIRTVSARLATARHAAQERTRLTDERATLLSNIANYARAQDEATQDVTTLRTHAGVADEPALREALKRWQDLRSIEQEAATVTADLNRLDDGKTRAALAAEAEGVDFDTIPARSEEIQQELNVIETARRQNAATLERVRADLAAMERGKDAAASAQAMETALADLDDIVLRYAPLHMAHTLLHAGIEQFRRQQQGPLLARAGALFARLTEGRYQQLEVDEDDNGTIQVVAVAADGGRPRSDRLSEGTQDQLYLALRLAAIEADAVAGEALPFIGDDLLVNFDDRRAAAALRVLSDFSRVTQVILFTHHDHIAAMADAGLARVHRLGL